MAMIDEMLALARSRLDRVNPADLDRKVAEGAIVVDIRTPEQRRSEGVMPGALIIDRNVLLWRLDPTSEARTVDVRPDQDVILMCVEGYASSLAAVELQRLGIRRATDLAGGYRAWRALRRG